MLSMSELLEVLKAHQSALLSLQQQILRITDAAKIELDPELEKIVGEGIDELEAANRILFKNAQQGGGDAS